MASKQATVASALVILCLIVLSSVQSAEDI
ncbi:hypothetical protein CCACVL1_28040 [Corchorus capsularis]|uniref:Uncharacterized protein n=1 Tax=Corchorus capsularis TaxID=210143 RepID=A0A1R3G7P8_COCAP|nr:hypothetical protein CCACVL1_28040 [Corchorus capsularis]